LRRFKAVSTSISIKNVILGAKSETIAFLILSIVEKSIVNAVWSIIVSASSPVIVIGIYAVRGSRIHANYADVTGAELIGIRSIEGSIISAINANAQRTPGTDSTADFTVATGGIISAYGGTGGTNITPNTITSSGIIFK